MKDKWLMIGVGATFVSFFLMIVSMMILSRQTAKNKELLANIPSAPQETAASVTSDFSIYKTIVGDDGRAMTEIPEGPFKMGSNDGDYDEAPQHQVYLKTFYIDKYEVAQAEYERFVKMTKRLGGRARVALIGFASSARECRGDRNVLERCRCVLSVGREAASERSGMGKGREGGRHEEISMGRYLRAPVRESRWGRGWI